MPKLDKRKVASDFQRIGREVAAAIDFLWMLMVCGLLATALYFSALHLLNANLYFEILFRPDLQTTILCSGLLTFIVILPLVAGHYRYTHSAAYIQDVLKELARSNDRRGHRQLRKYILGVLVQGAFVLATADVTCFCVRQVVGRDATVIAIASWLIGGGFAILILYLMSWFHGAREGKPEESTTHIRGTDLNTFAQAKQKADSLRNEQGKTK